MYIVICYWRKIKYLQKPKDEASTAQEQNIIHSKITGGNAHEQIIILVNYLKITWYAVDKLKERKKVE